MDAVSIAHEAKQLLAEAFGPRLRGVVLHGSQARGGASADSDIDLLVLLDGPIDVCDDLGTIVHALYDLETRCGCWLDAQPVAPEEFEQAEYGACRFAREEGVAL
jgi:predicted nucleotidyltransferase